MVNEQPLQRINHLQRMILVHSYIYYRKSSSIWDDFTYDEHCKELARMLQEYPEEAKKSDWARAFVDYDGSTGFNLPLDNPWVIQKGEYIYRICTEGIRKPKEEPRKALEDEQDKSKGNIKSINSKAPKWTAKQKRLW